MNERETIYERISELRKDKGLTQKKLCEIAGINTTQLNRIENGITGTVSSDVLIKLSKALNVSADYILGLTPVSTRKNYDISELGLSEGAVKSMVTGSVDVQALSRLIEHKQFSGLTRLIAAYFTDSVYAGIMARNDIINMATTTLADYMEENPESKTEVQQDIRFLKSHKLGDHEAEIEKIKSSFVAILKDIKKGVEAGDIPGHFATSEIFQQMREQLMSVAQSPHDISAENIAEIVTSMVAQNAALDEKSTELLDQFVKQVFTPKDNS